MSVSDQYKGNVKLRNEVDFTLIAYYQEGPTLHSKGRVDNLISE